MEDYIEFIKAGELLICPLEYKEKYILRCIECKEYYGLLETFWSHCLSHYGLDSKNVQTSLSQTTYNLEENDDECSVGTVESDSSIPGDGNENKQISQINAQGASSVHLPQQKHRTTEIITKEEPKIQEASYIYTDELEDTCPYQMENTIDHMECDNEEQETRNYVAEFLKSKKSVTVLISAYKNIPHMWDLNYSSGLRKKDQRAKSLQQIATKLNNIANEKITTKQVSAIIFYLRLKYKERLKCDKELSGEPATAMKDNTLPPWIFQQLAFLKPFMECNSIATLDSMQKDLVPEQIIQILNIYKKCSYLWDTNSLEYYCNNKRNEALENMLKIIENEMAIQVKKSTLKKYLRSIHERFSRERNRKGTIKSKIINSDVISEMSFLAEHVSPYKCTECNRSFRSRIQMKAHLSKHDGNIHLHCPLCQHEFKSAEAYINHARRHMGDLGEKCKECGKKFLKPAELRIHMRSHTGDKPFFCEVCGASFSQQQTFLEHKRRHEKKFVLFCPICSKGFYKMNAMKIHSASHYDIRNFECSICGKAFKTRKTLQSHEFTHEEGKNHGCDVCGKFFKNKINLLHHKRIHIYQLNESEL